MTKKTVLILGAGTTRAARASRSVSQRPPLDRDFFNIAGAINKPLTTEVVDCLKDLVGDYADTLSGSLELATTYLYIKALDSKPGNPYHVGFLKLLSLLHLVLAQTTNTIPIGPRSILYRFLLSELNKLAQPEDMTIITFNYDLILERVLESINIHNHGGTFNFPGCYRLDKISKALSVRTMPRFHKLDYLHNGVALLKLHGSLNWQSTHTSNKPTPRALLNTNRELHVLNSPDIAKDLSWTRKSRKVYMKPIIVPPISGKRGMMQIDVQLLWSKAGKALQNADRVVIAGYSCPPLDLESRILISENMRRNSAKRVYVVDPDHLAAGKFLELCDVDHVTNYISLSSWVTDSKKYSVYDI